MFYVHLPPQEHVEVIAQSIEPALQEEVNMVQHSGFSNSDKTIVCKLHKALNGLKQALFQFGFFSSKFDLSLFVYSHQGIVLYALVYVNDIFLTSSSSTLIHDLITKPYEKVRTI